MSDYQDRCEKCGSRNWNPYGGCHDCGPLRGLTSGRMSAGHPNQANTPKPDPSTIELSDWRGGEIFSHYDPKSDTTVVTIRCPGRRAPRLKVG